MNKRKLELYEDLFKKVGPGKPIFTLARLRMLSIAVIVTLARY